MYAWISTWRARAADFQALSREVAPPVAEVHRQPSYVAGHELQVAQDKRMIDSVWQTEEQMPAALDKSMAERVRSWRVAGWSWSMPRAVRLRRGPSDGLHLPARAQGW